jgi:hypothetical protein
MNAVEKEVKELVEKELKSANEKFPLFRSAHEGYAVILEEVEEAQEEMSYTANSLEYLWHDIKLNDNINLKNNIRVIKKHALNLVCETIQVAAMAQKFIDSLEDKNDKG